MRPVELIREGRNQLFERPWTQGDLCREDGSICALGSILVGVGIPDKAIISRGYSYFDDYNPLITETVGFLGQAAGPSPGGRKNDPLNFVYMFNDRAESLDEVIDLFDRAEKIAEEAELALPVETEKP